MVSPTSPTLQHWTALAAADFSVFPLVKHSKKPLGEWKHWQSHRASGEQIDAWFAAYPDCNVGIATGAISGIVVLDLDSDEASEIAEARGLPETVEALTPRGRHLYFAHPGSSVGNVTGSEDGKLPKGIDVRGDGGFVVAPGSYFIPSDKERGQGKLEGEYGWREGRAPGEVELAPMPGWLVLALASPVPAKAPQALPSVRPVSSDTRQAKWAQTALQRECDAVRYAVSGTRNDQLNRSAFAIAQIVAGGGLDAYEAHDELEAAALACGLGKAEIRATMTSGFEAGAKEPRFAPDDDVPARPASSPRESDPLGEFVCAADSAVAFVPDRRWLWDQWLPVGACTALFGDGGLGKSLIAKQIATAVATGTPLFGAETERANVLAFYCEDDAPELARRQQAVCRGMRVPAETLTGYQYQSRFGRRSLLGHIDKRTGEFVTNELYAQIRERARETGARLIILDNALHLFGDNINDPGAVTRFMNRMNEIALEIDGAVLLLGHIAKAEGSKFAGTSAWSNASRNRLFLGRPTDANEAMRNPDARILERPKSNYARSGDSLSIMWHEGAFSRPEDIGPAGAARTSQDATDNAAFLRLLDEFTAKQKPLSVHKQARNFAPRAMSKQPGLRHVATELRMERAMGRLLAAGQIVPDASLGFKNDQRKECRGIARSDKVALLSALQCASVEGNPQKTAENRAFLFAPEFCVADASECASVAENGGNPRVSDASQSALQFPQTLIGSVGAPEGAPPSPATQLASTARRKRSSSA